MGTTPRLVGWLVGTIWRVNIFLVFIPGRVYSCQLWIVVAVRPTLTTRLNVRVLWL